MSRFGVLLPTDRPAARSGLRFELPDRKDNSPLRAGTRRTRLLELLEAAGANGIDFFRLHEPMQKEGTAFGNLKSPLDALGLLGRGNSDTLRLARVFFVQVG